MKAKVICQNHGVLTYTLNGRKMHIVEELVKSHRTKCIESQVFNAINKVGRSWEAVYNYLDLHVYGGDVPDAVDKVICMHTK